MNNKLEVLYKASKERDLVQVYINEEMSLIAQNCYKYILKNVWKRPKYIGY